MDIVLFVASAIGAGFCVGMFAAYLVEGTNNNILGRD